MNNAQNVNDKISENMQKKAIYFADNLTYLIVTGYALLIINSTTDEYIQCLANLCLFHPSIKKETVPKSIESVTNEENVKSALKMISSNKIKKIITDYFENFGKANFVNNLI